VAQVYRKPSMVDCFANPPYANRLIRRTAVMSAVEWLATGNFSYRRSITRPDPR
jgi:hypothetical protein